MKSYIVTIEVQSGAYAFLCKRMINEVNEEKAQDKALVDECFGDLGENSHWTETGISDLGDEFHYTIKDCKEIPVS